MQHKWYGFNQLVTWGYYFGIVCMDNGQGLTDSPDKLLIFQLLYHNLYHVQQKNADEDYKLAVETSQRFRGGGTEIQLGGGGQRGRVRGCKAADYLHDVSACEGQELGGLKPPVPLPLQKSVKVCQSRLHCFHFPCSVIPYTHQPGKTLLL